MSSEDGRVVDLEDISLSLPHIKEMKWNWNSDREDYIPPGCCLVVFEAGNKTMLNNEQAVTLVNALGYDGEAFSTGAMARTSVIAI